MSRQDFISFVPVLIAIVSLQVVIYLWGFDGAYAFAAGVFMGGFVPLILMPWLRKKARP